MPTAKIAPSLLSCDFANLAAESKRMLELGADYLHMGECLEIKEAVVIITDAYCLFGICFIRRDGWVSKS
jgi:hypothetical protein